MPCPKHHLQTSYGLDSDLHGLGLGRVLPFCTENLGGEGRGVSVDLG